MTTYFRVPSSQSRGSRRTQILAAATGLVAAGSIAVTLAVAGGGSSGDAPQSLPAIPPSAVHAHPDRATLYQRSAETQQPSGAVDDKRAAERFHHFR